MKRVLVIEDDETLRFVYVAKLEMEGFKVDSSPNGEEGLVKAEANPPDVILLDMLMPKMNGLDFLRAFSPAKHPNTAIIVFSNASIPDTVSEAMRLGARRYLTKSSFTPAEMVRTVRELAGDEA